LGFLPLSSPSANSRRLTSINFGLDDEDDNGGEDDDESGGGRGGQKGLTAEQMFESVVGQRAAGGQMQLSDGEDCSCSPIEKIELL
jgi:hypothetical protein